MKIADLLFGLFLKMPYNCCIIGCKSNFRYEKKKFHYFTFPKEEALRALWVEAVGRKDFKPGKSSRVCNKHFNKSDIITDIISVDTQTGETIILPAGRAKLKGGAVPCLFLNNANESKTIKLESYAGRSRRDYSKIREDSSTSDDDEELSLEALKNRIIQNSFRAGDIDEKLKSEEHITNEHALRKKFKTLLEQYEEVKNRSVTLDQEIRKLSKVNFELKSKLFKPS